ncbi:MAG: hypothetical protein AAF539_14715, partial [Planctomycetota bacterium]
MQLDRTHVAIRARTLSEIGDLALRMIRQYPSAYLTVFWLGAIGWAILDVAILGWLPWQGFQWNETDFWLGRDPQDWLDLSRYVVGMITLVTLQTPLAGIFTTFYLGQAVFEKRPTVARTIAEVRSRVWALLWTLGFRRLTIPITLFIASRIGQPSSVFWDLVIPVAALLYAGVIQSNRPFLPEMLVLEKCPLRSRDPGVVRLSQRSRTLHRPMAGELGSRFLLVAMTLGIMAASSYQT